LSAFLSAPVYESWFHEVRTLCIDAADRALKGFNTNPSMIEKGRGDWSSALDLEIQDYITRELRRIAPDAEVFGEECEDDSAKTQSAKLRAGSLYWNVDPIDGSANFLRGIPHFATVISLSEVQLDGSSTTLMGVTADPCRRECFTSVLGAGTQINGRPSNTSNSLTPHRSLMAIVTPKPDNRHLTAYGRWLTVALSRFGGVRRSGAMALDLAWLSCGRLDAFMGIDLAPWDTRAGFLHVDCAGGACSEHCETWTTDSGERVPVTIYTAANSKAMLGQVPTIG